MKLFFNMNKKSLPQVVKQNESDIKELQEKIKPYYTTSVDLNKDSAVVDVSDTNIDESTFVNGYLLTENGKLFNIVSVDDGIAYISFMADFKGAKGDTGLAGGELTSFYFNPNNMGITYNDGKLNIVGQLTFTTASGGQTEQSTIGATIIVPIEGSDDIVVDANELGNGLSIHLDNDIITQIQSSVKNSQMLRNLIADSTTIVSAIDGQGKLVFYVDASITNKLAKALIVPMSAPSSTEIVGIDDGNSQVNIPLSNFLGSPSNQIINIALTGSETEWIAPGNGYVCFIATGNSSNSKVIIAVESTTQTFPDLDNAILEQCATGVNTISAFLPVSKNQRVHIEYTDVAVAYNNAHFIKTNMEV